MAKLLTIDEMLQCALDSKMDGAQARVLQFESLATTLAAELAEHLGISFSPAKFEHPEMCGTCAAFTPDHPGQECPDTLAQFDEGGRLGMKAKETHYKRADGSLIPLRQWQKVGNDFSIMPLKTTAYLRRDSTGEHDPSRAPPLAGRLDARRQATA